MKPSATISPPQGGESEQLKPFGMPGGAKPESRIPLAMTFEELFNSDASPDETADEIIQAVRQWRDTPSGRKAE